jgi:NTE family protein
MTYFKQPRRQAPSVRKSMTPFLFYGIVAIMLKRFSAPALFCCLLLQYSQAYPEQTPLHFKPTYATVHGGLQTALPSQASRAPSLGLALAGGGAKAAASVGVLKVLKQEGIPVRAIAGTSMGAVVGGLAACGYAPEEIERILRTNDWNDIFNDRPARAFLTQEQKESGSRHLLEFTFQQGRIMPPTGLSAGQKLTNLLAARTIADSFAANLDFNRLPVPFRAVATDIETGEAVVLDRGLLHDAVRASAAIPLVFQPVEIQGRLLVDGGLVNNLPVEVVRAMGPDVVVAVDSSARLEKRERLVSFVEIMSQSVSLPVRRECERQAALADLVITPDTSDYSFTDFPTVSAIIAKGEEAARAALPRIRELLKSREAADGNGARFRITSLVINGADEVSDATIRFAMTPALAPREVSSREIDAILVDLYRLGHFSDVSLILEREGSGHRALLTVTENPVITSVVPAGNTVVSTGEILSALDWQTGQMLNSTRLATELDKIIEKYRSKGYLLARVERTGITPEGALEVVFQEGRVDSITIIGQTKTRRSLIRRETLTRTGAPLNFNSAAYDIQHLYALDYFESVSADITRSPKGGIDLTYRIREKATNRIRLGLRYDLEDRFTALTDAMVDNVGGRGVKLFLNTRYGNYTDITFGYRSPLVVRTNFLHTVDGFYRERNFYLYQDKQIVQEREVTRKGAEVAFGYQWFRFGDTYLRYRFASDTTTGIFGMSQPEETVRIGTWAFLSTVDTRDSSTFPHKGTLMKFSYERADSAYGGDIEYAKTSLSGQACIPLGERHTAILEAAGGIGSGSIPYQEQYGIGGADHLISVPLLGYERREFVGNDLLALSAAYRFRITDYQLTLIKAVYLNLAYQAGNVWDQRDAMSFGDLRSGGGIGLYADTLIGPFRLDYARGEQKRYAVYFSAGFDF